MLQSGLECPLLMKWHWNPSILATLHYIYGHKKSTRHGERSKLVNITNMWKNGSNISHQSKYIMLTVDYWLKIRLLRLKNWKSSWHSIITSKLTILCDSHEKIWRDSFGAKRGTSIFWTCRLFRVCWNTEIPRLNVSEKRKEENMQKRTEKRWKCCVISTNHKMNNFSSWLAVDSIGDKFDFSWLENESYHRNVCIFRWTCDFDFLCFYNVVYM